MTSTALSRMIFQRIEFALKKWLTRERVMLLLWGHGTLKNCIPFQWGNALTALKFFIFFSQLYSNKVGLRNFLNLLIIKAKEIWDLISKWLSLVTKISQNLLQKYNHLLYLHCLRLFWKIAISKLKACSKLVFPLERSIFHSSRCYEDELKRIKDF